MQAFHWIRVQVFCYATERQELLEETMAGLLGTSEFTEDVSEGEHGETMLILEARLTKQKEFKALFSNFGEGMRSWIAEDMENRVDDDCMFYMRIDKQKAVQGVYEVAHHGDVISITGKIQSHPARKEVACEALSSFIGSLSAPQEAPPS
jgi:RNA binding exosome subunit